jgi:hypothetical protein
VPQCRVADTFASRQHDLSRRQSHRLSPSASSHLLPKPAGGTSLTVRGRYRRMVKNTFANDAFEHFEIAACNSVVRWAPLQRLMVPV